MLASFTDDVTAMNRELGWPVPIYEEWTIYTQSDPLILFLHESLLENKLMLIGFVCISELFLVRAAFVVWHCPVLSCEKT